MSELQYWSCGQPVIESTSSSMLELKYWVGCPYTMIKVAAVATAIVQLNIGNAWKDYVTDEMKLNIDNAWKTVTEFKVNIGNVWKTIF